LETVENVSSFDALFVPVNVLTNPSGYMDKNSNVTENSIIASVNVLKPNETTSNFHVERNDETHVEPNGDLVNETPMKPCVDYVSQVDHVSDKVVKPSSTPYIFGVFVDVEHHIDKIDHVDVVVIKPPRNVTCLVLEPMIYEIGKCTKLQQVIK